MIDRNLAQGAIKVFYENLDDCAELAHNPEDLAFGVNSLKSDLELDPPSYVAVEIDDDSRKVIGAINGLCAFYSNQKGKPSKVPASALAKMGDIDPKKVFYIDTIAVDSQHRKKGIASTLIEKCSVFALENGYEYLFLRTDNTNQNQSVVDFYRNKNWEELGPCPDGKNQKTHFYKKLNPVGVVQDFIVGNVKKNISEK